jgi:hypothetical protein
MSSLPEHQGSAAAHDEPSPHVSRFGFVGGCLLTPIKPHLPSDLLDSSPEIGTLAQTISRIVNTPTEPTAATGHATFAQIATFTREPRYKDVVMEMNEGFEHETWGAMSGESRAPHSRIPQEGDTFTSSPGPPGPAQPSSPSQNAPQLHTTRPHPTEQPATFLPPGYARTAEQRAAAATFNAAVAARARQQGEAGRARQAHLNQLNSRSINEEVDEGDSGRETRTIEVYRQQIGSQGSPVHVTGCPGPAGLNQMPAQMPAVPDPQTYQQPYHLAPLPVPANASGYQQPSVHGPQQPGNSANSAVQYHQGDSIFNEMMNNLIADGRAGHATYRQVQLRSNRPTPFGREFLYCGEWVSSDHWLFSKARVQSSLIRAIRNARNGDLVGWYDSESFRPGKLHLFPTENQGRWVPEGGQSGERSRGRR